MFDDEYQEYEPTGDTSLTVPVEVTVGWHNATVIREATDQVANRIYDDIKAEVTKRVIPTLDDHVNLAIASVLDQEVQPTDKFGKSMGAAVSIRDLLMKDAEQWLNQQVDGYGRSEGRGYGTRMSRVEYLFKKALKGDDNRKESPIAKMAKAALAAQIGDVTEMVQQAVQEQVAKKLKR